MKIHYFKPQYTLNYNKGYIGFTYNHKNLFSKGITYFTKLDNLSGISVSHALIVIDENTCIEATIKGVKYTKLNKYFKSNKYNIFFRKPINFSNEMAESIVEKAKTFIGLKYDFSLYIAHIFKHSIIGKFIDSMTGNRVSKYLYSLTDTKEEFVCSEFVAKVLQLIPELAIIGILSEKTAGEINPQELFEDVKIFKDWKKD